MMRRFFLLGLFAVTLAVHATGCCVDGGGIRRGRLGRALHHQGDGDCGEGCGHRGYGPLQIARRRATDCAGCGELYLDEWISDPPDCCDPCDGHGNHVGHVGFGDGGCGGCGECGPCLRRYPLRNFGFLMGRRYHPGASYAGFDEGWEESGGGGCCGGAEGHAIHHEGEEIEGPAAPRSAPKQTPTPAARQTQSAIKKSASRQPYYEPSEDRTGSMGRSTMSSRSASSRNLRSSGSRVMR